jgi:hypothetical protein
LPLVFDEVLPREEAKLLVLDRGKALTPSCHFNAWNTDTQERSRSLAVEDLLANERPKASRIKGFWFCG